MEKFENNIPETIQSVKIRIERLKEDLMKNEGSNSGYVDALKDTIRNEQAKLEEMERVEMNLPKAA